MARGRQPRRAPAVPSNQGEPPAPPTEGPAEGNATPSEAGSESSSLTRGSLTPIDIPELTPGPAPPASTDELFKLFMQTYMDTVKNQVQAPVEPKGATPQGSAPPAPVEPIERPLEGRYPDLYSGKSRLDCHRFIQQCENHFDAAGATGKNRTYFAATFLRDRMSLLWGQYKKRHALEKGPDVPIPWEEFKAFLERTHRKTWPRAVGSVVALAADSAPPFAHFPRWSKGQKRKAASQDDCPDKRIRNNPQFASGSGQGLQPLTEVTLRKQNRRSAKDRRRKKKRFYKY